MNVNFLLQHGQVSCDESERHTGATVSAFFGARPWPSPPPPSRSRLLAKIKLPLCPCPARLPLLTEASIFCFSLPSRSWNILAKAVSHAFLVAASGTLTMKDLILLLIWNKNCSGSEGAEAEVTAKWGEGTSSTLKL